MTETAAPPPPSPPCAAPSEADASTSVEVLLAVLPGLAAAVVAHDVASGCVDGVRSAEHDRLVGVVRSLRSRLRAGEASALRALVAAGYDATSAMRWLRSDDAGEPRAQRADDDVVRIPVVRTADDLLALRDLEGGTARGGGDGAVG